MDKDKLVERCEDATGPDREIDYGISEAIGKGCVRGSRPLREDHAEETGGLTIPRYTASLDAAMTLVPEGTELHIEVKKSGIWAFVGAPVRAAKAATPALAFCAAALRSHAPK